MPNTPRTRSQTSQPQNTALETPPRSSSRNRNTVTTASSVSSGPSPSSFRKRQNELRNSRDEDIDEDSTYYGGALLKTRPDLLTEASERAAEKLQAALEGSSIEEHFTKFIPNDVMRKIIMRQKAMKNLVVKHREFWTGDSLKPLKELSTNEFVKLMRLCFGNETGDLSGAQQQILRALHGKPLTYTNYVELEDACLQIAQISETYALNSQTQRNIVTLAIKQLRSEHPPADTNHEEAKALLDRVVAKGAIYTIDEFTCEVLSELCENKTVERSGNVASPILECPPKPTLTNAYPQRTLPTRNHKESDRKQLASHAAAKVTKRPSALSWNRNTLTSTSKTNHGPNPPKEGPGLQRTKTCYQALKHSLELHLLMSILGSNYSEER